MCIQLLGTTERAQGTCTPHPKSLLPWKDKKKGCQKSEQDTGSKPKSEGEGGKGTELPANMSSIKITLCPLTT